MSQVLDALRRPARSVKPEKTVRRHPDAKTVLSGMGYASGRRWVMPSRAALALAVTALVALAFWSSFRTRDPDAPLTSEPGAPAVSSPMPRTPTAAPAVEPDESQRQPPGPSEATVPIVQRPAEPAHPAAGAASDRFLTAVALHRAGELDRAARLYRDLLSHDGLAAQAHNNLGLIHQARGELDEAAAQFRRVARRNPEYATAHNNLGVVLLAQGRPRQAAQHFSTAARLQPRDADPLVNLALTQAGVGRPGQARESLLLALALAPRHGAAHYNLAVLYDRAGEVRRAIEHYRTFLEDTGDAGAARAAEVRARLEALEDSQVVR